MRFTTVQIRPVSLGKEYKMVGVYAGIVAVFCVLCGVAEALEVPVIYAIIAGILVVLGAISVVLERDKDA